jgi:two-component system OmpR family sensor kinase
MSSGKRWHRQVSITRRLVAAVTIVITLSWFLAVGFGLFVMQDEFSEIFDSGLQQTTERLLPLIVDDLAEQDTADAPARLSKHSSDDDEYLIYQARDSSGKVLLHSHDSSATPFDVPLAVGFADTPTQRIYTAGTVDGSLYVQVADDLEHRQEAIVEAGTALALPLVALIPASIFAIIFVIRRSLAPIQDFRDEIGGKDGGNLAPLDRSHLPVELQPIAHSVNLLLGKLKSAIDAEREFTANSAHELRTPIAGALAQTQRLMAEAPDELQPRVGQIEKSLTHLGRLAEKLLQLARAEAGIGVSNEITDLMPVLRIVVDDIERSSIGEGRIRISAAEGLKLRRPISSDAFAIVIRNLVENALVHSPPGTQVIVDVDHDGRIGISNDASVIDAQTLEGLTARFARGATTRASGSGLGLSIVKGLVEQMNGRLSLMSPAPGRPDGFEAAIEI